MEQTHGLSGGDNPRKSKLALHHEAERVGLVVLRELPRTRETLLLRLMGASEVLREAIAELGRLPTDAWERDVAMPPLLALRIEIPQDPTDEDEREYLMSTMELYEQWEQKIESKGVEQGVKKGPEQGVKKMLPRLYQARFGAPPPAILAAIDAMHDADTLDHWADLFTGKSAEEIAAALDPATTREG